MSELRAVAPTGSPIVGTLERLSGVAQIEEASWGREDGRLTFQHDGYTDVDWNSETTVTRKGALDDRQHPVFVDEDGAEWTEDQLKLVDPDEEPDEDGPPPDLNPEGDPTRNGAFG